MLQSISHSDINNSITQMSSNVTFYSGPPLTTLVAPSGDCLQVTHLAEGMHKSTCYRICRNVYNDNTSCSDNAIETYRFFESE